MIDTTWPEHPDRRALTNELHARPFQPAAAPGRALHLAFLLEDGADPAPHLLALLDHFGAGHPAPGAAHHSADFGRFRMKWERHTEFVAYTFQEKGPVEALFEERIAGHLPPGWVAAAPGRIIAAAQIELIRAPSREASIEMLSGPLRAEFVGESLASAEVLDGHALALSDFRLHEGGLTRFALIHDGDVGPRRLGRMVQRLIDIEVYRALAMLALPLARRTAAGLSEIETALAEMTTRMADQPEGQDDRLLRDLMALSVRIEALSAGTAYRFAAARAYEAIVMERMEMIRERRFAGRQGFGEFMVRRFMPAMRTVHAVDRRLSDLSARASRVGELLRTRVNVAVEAGNQNLLSSMDRRAALQLRLQETVEGLSVVAISYYAVSLAGYLLGPLAKPLGIDKVVLMAMATVPVVGTVWWLIRRMRRRLEGK